MVDRTTRPIVPTEHANEREHRRLLATRANAAMPKDGTEAMAAPLKLMSYAIADLPDASLYPGAVVYITDTNSVAFSNGTAWVTSTGLLDSDTFSGVSSLQWDVSSYSAYRFLELSLYGVTQTVNNQFTTFLTISTDGGATFLANYSQAVIDNQTGGGPNGTYNAAAQFSIYGPFAGTLETSSIDIQYRFRNWRSTAERLRVEYAAQATHFAPNSSVSWTGVSRTDAVGGPMTDIKIVPGAVMTLSGKWALYGWQ